VRHHANPVDPTALRELTTRISALVREYGTRDDPDGAQVSFLWSLHGTDESKSLRG